MMPLGRVLVGRDHRFFIVAFRGDASIADRLWVCVRGEEAPANGSWSGCWSRGTRIVEPDFRRFLEQLEERVASGGRLGPFGPYLDDHYFFDGWEFWGNGVPAPLVDVRPGDAVDGAAPAASVDDLATRLAPQQP